MENVFEVTLNDGRKVVASMEGGKDLKHGESYVVYGSAGWKLLTCNNVVRDKHWVEPIENDYFYDISECCKVVSIDKPRDPQEVYEFIAEALKLKYGNNVRYGYPDGRLENANKNWHWCRYCD